jgi:hypothetical protein
MDINKPDVVAQIDAAFDAYERALVHNDIATLDRYFWNTPATVRYGVAENLYGAQAIRAYRRQCPPVHPGRRIERRVTTSFGDDAGTVSIEFSAPDDPRVGRQMQTWVRFPEGWQIVAAHVSMP